MEVGATSWSEVIGEHIGEWERRDVISHAQAEAIRRYEGLSDAEQLVPARLTVGSEVAAYLGSALALMGGIVVVGRHWRDLAFVGRISIAAALALVGFAVGTWLVRLAEPGTRRLGGFLWLLGTTGAALALGVVVDELDTDHGVAAIVIGLLVSIIGLDLWRNTDMPIQLATFVVGLGIIVGGVLDATQLDVWLAGLVVWPVAIGWFAVAAWGHLEPRFIALVAGFVSAMLAAAMLSDLDRHLGPGAAVFTAALMVAFALVDRSTPLLVVGIIGFVIAVQALLATTFSGPAASGVVTVVGLAVVVATIAKTRRVS